MHRLSQSTSCACVCVCVCVYVALHCVCACVSVYTDTDTYVHARACIREGHHLIQAHDASLSGRSRTLKKKNGFSKVKVQATMTAQRDCPTGAMFVCVRPMLNPC